jgi:hypothetical protein
MSEYQTTVGIQILDKSDFWMVDFRKAQAFEFPTIWNPDEKNRTTIEFQIALCHLITGPEIKWFRAVGPPFFYIIQFPDHIEGHRAIRESVVVRFIQSSF